MDDVSTIDRSSHEINVKIVYYGPGLGGKTSSLQAIHDRVTPNHRGKMISLSTGEDRTLYFDFFPLKLPKVRGYSIKVHLYTVPGQNHYNSTRKLVLNGADGVVFVADSQSDRFEANLESMRNLEENLRDQAVALVDMPLVMQYNKRDVPNITPVSELEDALNPRGVPSFESVAIANRGVFDGLREITKIVMRTLSGRHATQDPQDTERTAVPSNPPPPPAEEEFVFVGTANSFDDISNKFNRPRLSDLEREDPTPTAEAAPTEPEPPAQEGNGKGDEPIAAVGDSAPSPALAPASAPETLEDSEDASLLDLIEIEWIRETGREAQRYLAEGQWAGAVHLVLRAALRMAGDLAPSAQDPWPVAAVLLGVPADRFVRFESVARRYETGAPIAREDALFALFFLVDTAMRHRTLVPDRSATVDEPASNQPLEHS